MENDKIINGNCWVAYFDILGFKDDVEHFPPEGVLEKYIEVLKEIARHNVNCKFFSDSFVFYTEDDSEYSFRRIDAALKFFFRAMFTQYIPMRGCLNVGQFYVDEKKGIFFNRSLIEAHNLAEDQNWIGFVLSEKVRERIYDFKDEVFKRYRDKLEKYYVEYQVPYKKEKKKKHMFLVYKLTINPDVSNQQAKHDQKTLWKFLKTMKDIAVIHLNERIKRKKIVGLDKFREYRNVMIKYENIKDFLLYVYPALKGMVRKKNPPIFQSS